MPQSHALPRPSGLGVLQHGTLSRPVWPNPARHFSLLATETQSRPEVVPGRRACAAGSLWVPDPSTVCGQSGVSRLPLGHRNYSGLAAEPLLCHALLILYSVLLYRLLLHFTARSCTFFSPSIMATAEGGNGNVTSCCSREEHTLHHSVATESIVYVSMESSPFDFLKRKLDAMTSNR